MMNSVLLPFLLVAFILVEILLGGGGVLLHALPGFMVLGGAGVLSVLFLRKSILRARTWCLATAIGWAGYLVWRALVSPVPFLAGMDLHTILAALLVYLLTAIYLTQPRARLTLVALILLLAVIQVGVGLVQFSQQNNFMLFPFVRRPDYGWRASGFYGCPNHLAGFLELAAVFAISLACWARWPAWLKLLAGWVALVCIAGQFTTGSRGGYLSLAAALGTFALLSVTAVRRAVPYRFWLVTALVVVGAAATFAGLVYVTKTEQIGQRIRNIPDTKNMRVELWKGAFQQFRLAPLTGTGAGTYRYYGRLFRPPSIGHDPIYVHNDYLHLLAEYGALGVIGMLLFLGAHVWSGLRSLQAIMQERMIATGRVQSSALALNLAAFGAVAAYALHSIVDFNLHIPANALLMAFVFGILANPGVKLSDSPRGTAALNLLSRILPPALGAVLILAGFRLLPGEYYAERARRALRDDDFSRAAAFAQSSIRREKSNPDAFYYLGWSQYQISRDFDSSYARKRIGEAAITSLREGVQLFPQDTRLLLALGHALQRLDRFEEANQFYREAVRWDPNSAFVLARYGNMLREKGDPAAAREAFEKSLQLRETQLAREGIEQLEQKASGAVDPGSIRTY